MFKKISAGILSALMITAVAVSGTGCSQTQPASIDYKTADKVADGAILQAFCWDFNTIKESMGDIAAAGFSAVQTSPINECLEGEDGAVHPMAGALPGAGVRRQKLVRFGYAQLTARADSLLLRAGETVPVHEFHYWDSTENGAAFNAQKPATGRSWTCGFAGPALYAAFPHLYFAGRPQLAERFVRAAAAFQSGR